MKLSALQRFILREAYVQKKGRAARRLFERFYDNKTVADSRDSLTKSLERLIDKGLMIGYGRRTPEKWFIDEVKLTALGRSEAKRALGQQQQLPLK